MKSIDMTPTRSEYARVTAYILASHLDGSPSEFGDYWHLTELQEDSLFATWNALESMNVGDFDWKNLPKSHKKKLIRGTFNDKLANLSK